VLLSTVSGYHRTFAKMVKIRQVDFPLTILDAQRAGKLVIFAGAGVSMDSPPTTLGDVLSHELGAVDSVWYHGASIEDKGVAVRQENQTRQLNGEPMRIGHGRAGDVDLEGVLTERC
jgi:hypothetical protein